MENQTEKTMYTLAELRDAAGSTAPATPGMSTKRLAIKAYDRANDWLIQAAMEQNWVEETIEQWVGILRARGFDDAEVSYSGFWSQGDGASFTANVNVNRYLDFNALQAAVPFLSDAIYHGYADVIGQIVRVTNQYSHSRTVRPDMDLRFFNVPGGMSKEWEDTVEEQYSELVAHIGEVVVGLSDGIYSDLKSNYDHLTSEDALMEMAEANGYTFDESGHPQ